MNATEISKFIMDTMEDIVYVSDPSTYDLYYLNGECLRKYGFTDDSQWRRKKCYKILQGLDEPCPFCTNNKLNSESFYNWEYYNPLLDKYFYIQDRFIRFEGVKARLEIAKDISEQKHLEKKLNEQIGIQKMLRKCIETLQSPLTPSESINELLKLISNFYQAERGYIFAVIDGLVYNTYEWCAEGIIPQIDMLQGITLDVVDRWFVKFRSDGGFYINSLIDEVDTSSVEYEMLAMQEISSLITSPLFDANGEITGFIGVDNPKKFETDVETLSTISKVIIDFFDKIETYKVLNDLSYMDKLTGLKNRNSYSENIQNLLTANTQSLGVVYVDINGLKMVNDKFGHKIGDKYIIAVANEVNKYFPNSSYRIGGDEFVVVCTGLTKEDCADRVKLLSESLKIGKRSKASVGYTWCDNSKIITKQIESADAAMYVKKQEYYNSISVDSDIEFARFYLEYMENEPEFAEIRQNIIDSIKMHEESLKNADMPIENA
ncbi:MAG: GGDEF domain-containing protein [Clostridia bacterium]